MERDVNPPEPKESYEPDVDSINDEIWLLEKEDDYGNKLPHRVDPKKPKKNDPDRFVDDSGDA